MTNDIKLIKLYASGMLQSEIAKELGLSTGQISVRVKQLKLPRRGKAQKRVIPLDEETRQQLLRKFY